MKPWLTTVIGSLIGIQLAVNFGGPDVSAWFPPRGAVCGREVVEHRAEVLVGEHRTPGGLEHLPCTRVDQALSQQ